MIFPPLDTLVKKEGIFMEKDTEQLLRETNYGVKLAIMNMKNILDEAEDGELMKLIVHQIDEHEKLEQKTSDAMNEHGYEEKAVSAMMHAFSDVTTELKMLWRDDTAKIAEMLVDGCNMGIKNISQTINQCENASKEAKALAEELIHTEDRFLRKLQPFL